MNPAGAVLILMLVNLGTSIWLTNQQQAKIELTLTNVILIYLYPLL